IFVSFVLDSPLIFARTRGPLSSSRAQQSAPGTGQGKTSARQPPRSPPLASARRSTHAWATFRDEGFPGVAGINTWHDFIACARWRSKEAKTHRDLRGYPNWLTVLRTGLEAPLHDSANRLLVESHSEGP